MYQRSADALVHLLQSREVVVLPDLRAALGDASRATTFRYLQRVPYRRSYNCNGRYYTRHDPARYDRWGLWSHRAIYFSEDGSLSLTLRRLISESPAGYTHNELQHLLRVRVQPLLLAALERGWVARERVQGVYVYSLPELASRAAQLQQRHELLDAEQSAVSHGDVVSLSERVIIEVLLVVIRHRGATPAQVARRLRGHSPAIPITQVREVFACYDLDSLGEKGGTSNC